MSAWGDLILKLVISLAVGVVVWVVFFQVFVQIVLSLEHCHDLSSSFIEGIGNIDIFLLFMLVHCCTHCCVGSLRCWYC
jgi:hypothetical protein